MNIQDETEELDPIETVEDLTVGKYFTLIGFTTENDDKLKISNYHFKLKGVN